eukprot:TRINITY_DN5597_c0_g1_i1.p1 TRINITY_DN5597_c0_g1~~TRINITY_DN5597_c0_g1_i1.p1  ORF type:complete len:869 (+),score=192.74 TRINITY_DN5597_c0_g1_i1:157-2607(+)
MQDGSISYVAVPLNGRQELKFDLMQEMPDSNVVFSFEDFLFPKEKYDACKNNQFKVGARVTVSFADEPRDAPATITAVRAVANGDPHRSIDLEWDEGGVDTVSPWELTLISSSGPAASAKPAKTPAKPVQKPAPAPAPKPAPAPAPAPRPPPTPAAPLPPKPLPVTPRPAPPAASLPKPAPAATTSATPTAPPVPRIPVPIKVPVNPSTPRLPLPSVPITRAPSPAPSPSVSRATSPAPQAALLPTPSLVPARTPAPAPVPAPAPAALPSVPAVLIKEEPPAEPGLQSPTMRLKVKLGKRPAEEDEKHAPDAKRPKLQPDGPFLVPAQPRRRSPSPAPVIDPQLLEQQRLDLAERQRVAALEQKRILADQEELIRERQRQREQEEERRRDEEAAKERALQQKRQEEAEEQIVREREAARLRELEELRRREEARKLDRLREEELLRENPGGWTGPVDWPAQAAQTKAPLRIALPRVAPLIYRPLPPASWHDQDLGDNPPQAVAKVSLEERDPPPARFETPVAPFPPWSAAAIPATSRFPDDSLVLNKLRVIAELDVPLPVLPRHDPNKPPRAQTRQRFYSRRLPPGSKALAFASQPGDDDLAHRPTRPQRFCVSLSVVQTFHSQVWKIGGNSEPLQHVRLRFSVQPETEPAASVEMSDDADAAEPMVDDDAALDSGSEAEPLIFRRSALRVHGQDSLTASPHTTLAISTALEAVDRVGLCSLFATAEQTYNRVSNDVALFFLSAAPAADKELRDTLGTTIKNFGMRVHSAGFCYSDPVVVEDAHSAVSIVDFLFVRSSFVICADTKFVRGEKNTHID